MVDVAANLPPIQGDAVPLRQALLNLLNNASDAVAGVDAERPDDPRGVLPPASEASRSRLPIPALD